MKIGFQPFLVFFVVEREENRQKKMIIGISGFWFFWSKNGRFVTHMFFQKKVCWNPIFIVFLGRALLGPSCQKREILDTHPKKKKNLTDNWEAHFWVFFGFSCFFSFFALFCFLCFGVFCLFFGGFKGHVRWPEGPPHLALNPSFFWVFVLFLFFVGFVGFLLEGLRVRWGGPKGHLTWP